MNKIDLVINEVLGKIKLEYEIFEKIKKISKDFCMKLSNDLNKKGILADVFVGGSLAKKTLVKKDKYDIDVFVRFNKKYIDSDISVILEKVLSKKVEKIHGSRDYFQLEVEDNIIIEIIPVIKISKPENNINVTDLSYFHVKYMSNRTKENPGLSDEIILCKSFCHACDCYGAESYIQGFSGYAIELLISYYGSFKKFITFISKSKVDEKIIIDENKFYSNKNNVLKEMNEAKILNPIILIDPTFKERNALSSLSNETFEKFREYCKSFLKNPSVSYFEVKDIQKEMESLNDVRIVSIVTTKQAGDISGTKSKKFFNFFIRELLKEFKLKRNEFFYDDKKNISFIYLVVDKKSDEIKKGPPVSSVQGMNAFKKVHPDSYIKNNYSWIKISHDLSFDKFFKKFVKDFSKVINEMSIKEIRLVK
ncbi:hypothetical protein GOV12_02755 [Candidatus Pacearchaeota archaeon]|nr:hypothetical protein [Candidatus Pacearchaeota archaeon]